MPVQGVIKMAVTLRVRRSRGALSGLLLVLLGAWGALAPFVGPYFHYAYTPNRAFDYTMDRLWLEILPGAAALLGGAVALVSRHRLLGVLGAWLAAVGGAWFAVGRIVAPLWTNSSGLGSPVGDTLHSVLEQIGMFTGLGIVIVFLAAVAIGRFTVVSTRDIVPAQAPSKEDEPETAQSTSTGPLRAALTKVVSGR
jgi:hypothetical protein